MVQLHNFNIRGIVYVIFAENVAYILYTHRMWKKLEKLSPADFVSLPTDKEIQSIILMVGLF